MSKDLKSRLEFRGFDHNDGLEGQMAAHVEYQMLDKGHWTELKPQIKRNDNGNSLSDARHLHADADRVPAYQGQPNARGQVPVATATC